MTIIAGLINSWVAKKLLYASHLQLVKSARRWSRRILQSKQIPNSALTRGEGFYNQGTVHTHSSIVLFVMEKRTLFFHVTTWAVRALSPMATQVDLTGYLSRPKSSAWNGSRRRTYKVDWHKAHVGRPKRP